jgi:hypothetical protein
MLHCKAGANGRVRATGDTGKFAGGLTQIKLPPMHLA